MSIALRTEPGSHRAAIDKRLEAWKADSFGSRVWNKDATLWAAEPVAELQDRLGWLDLPAGVEDLIPGLQEFANEVTSDHFDHVVVLGMGGSSLAPEVFQAIFGNRPGHPELLVLDSTHPDAIRGVEDRIDTRSTLFIVSSKSGTTLETLSFMRYFWQKVAGTGNEPGRQFVAITDAGSPLGDLAAERKFRRVFVAPGDVGGRYSALTEFGLVPAAIIGVDLDQMARLAVAAAALCGPGVTVDRNPALILAAFLGELAAAGRNKATFIASARLRPAVAWIEQLVAESTGKDGVGIIPIDGDEDIVTIPPDRAFVLLEESSDPIESNLERLIAGGHPVARLTLTDTGDLGGVMFVLEMAVAAAGAILAIHPFNQPDVQVAKELARRAMAGDLDVEDVVTHDALSETLSAVIRKWLDGVAAPEYVGIHAYLPPTPATRTALDTARRLIRDAGNVAVTCDFGPRFLHSTGQLHKGGPATGRFLQLLDRSEYRVKIPESDFEFGDLVEAQSLGDYQALESRGQHVLRLSLGRAGASGLEAILGAIASATHNDE